MEAFQQSLDALLRESNELIVQCQDAMVTAVEKGNIAPGRIAVTLAQRFTEERIASSFPVLSLLDYVLAFLAKTPPGPGQLSSVALAAVLVEFWKLAPPLFVFYSSVPEAGLKDKVLKRLRRWKQRNLLSEPTVGKLISAVEDGPENKGTGDGGEVGGESGTGTSPADGPHQPPEEQHSTFTHAQTQAFSAVLRRCTSMLEQLTPARSRPYLELIEQEHFTRPTAAAFVFFQDLLSELQQRELGVSATSATAKGVDEKEGGQQSENASGNRAALGRLLDKLSASSGDDGGKDGAAGSAASVVIRYTSPLFSDVHLRQPLPQRPGFAGLAKRRLSAAVGSGAGGSGGAGSGDMYYPKKEATTRRPFRVPVSAMAAAQEGPAVRTWFPTPQAWLSLGDTGEAPTFATREEAQIMVRDGWHGGGGGGRKRPRE